VVSCHESEHPDDFVFGCEREQGINDHAFFWRAVSMPNVSSSADQGRATRGFGSAGTRC
jgi:hypothetical protein